MEPLGLTWLNESPYMSAGVSILPGVWTYEIDAIQSEKRTHGPSAEELHVFGLGKITLGEELPGWPETRRRENRLRSHSLRADSTPFYSVNSGMH